MHKAKLKTHGYIWVVSRYLLVPILYTLFNQNKLFVTYVTNASPRYKN